MNATFKLLNWTILFGVDEEFGHYCAGREVVAPGDEARYTGDEAWRPGTAGLVGFSYR